MPQGHKKDERCTWQKYEFACFSVTSLTYLYKAHFLHHFEAYHICKWLFFIYFFPQKKDRTTVFLVFLALWIVCISISFEISWEELFWISWAPLSLWHAQIREPAVPETH